MSYFCFTIKKIVHNIYFKLITLKVLINSPDLVFHILIFVSSDPLANVYSSGENTTELTEDEYPFQ